MDFSERIGRRVKLQDRTFLDRWAAKAPLLKGRAVPERCSSLLVPSLRCAQPVFNQTEGLPMDEVFRSNRINLSLLVCKSWARADLFF
jgi:hypothetical protein